MSTLLTPMISFHWNTLNKLVIPGYDVRQRDGEFTLAVKDGNRYWVEVCDDCYKLYRVQNGVANMLQPLRVAKPCPKGPEGVANPSQPVKRPTAPAQRRV